VAELDRVIRWKIYTLRNDKKYTARDVSAEVEDRFPIQSAHAEDPLFRVTAAPNLYLSLLSSLFSQVYLDS